MASFKQRLKRRLVSKPRYLLILRGFKILDMSTMPDIHVGMPTQPRVPVHPMIWPKFVA